MRPFSALLLAVALLAGCDSADPTDAVTATVAFRHLEAGKTYDAGRYTVSDAPEPLRRAYQAMIPVNPSGYGASFSYTDLDLDGAWVVMLLKAPGDAFHDVNLLAQPQSGLPNARTSPSTRASFRSGGDDTVAEVLVIAITEPGGSASGSVQVFFDGAPPFTVDLADHVLELTPALTVTGPSLDWRVTPDRFEAEVEAQGGLLPLSFVRSEYDGRSANCDSAGPRWDAYVAGFTSCSGLRQGTFEYRLFLLGEPDA